MVKMLQNTVLNTHIRTQNLDMRGLGTYVFKSQLQICQSFVGSKESNEAIAHRGSAHSGN